MNSRIFVRKLYHFTLIIALLYLFLVSISAISMSFKLFGKEFSERLIQTTSNPFVGLFIGILTTAIVQSSSTTTSMVVGFVAAGTLTIPCAIPIVMGANIGTTVTNTLVSLGHITRKDEFKRAFAGAIIHDIFNVLAVLILLPLELTTGFLEKIGSAMAKNFYNLGGIHVVSPIKTAVGPVVSYTKNLLIDAIGFPEKISGIILLAMAIVLLITSLFFLVRVMRSVIARRTEVILDKLIGKHGLSGMFLGFLFTAIVQSSSVTTSILVPLLGSGILNVAQAFPITLGANIGTTVTAIIASLTGNIAAITIAFVHLLFNICGILLLYPFKITRNIPVWLAEKIADKCIANKFVPILFIGLTFFVVPGVLIWIFRLIN